MSARNICFVQRKNVYLIPHLIWSCLSWNSSLVCPKFSIIIMSYHLYIFPFQFPCINQEKKAKKKKYDNSGYVCVESIKVKTKISQQSYLVQSIYENKRQC